MPDVISEDQLEDLDFSKHTLQLALHLPGTLRVDALTLSVQELQHLVQLLQTPQATLHRGIWQVGTAHPGLAKLEAWCSAAIAWARRNGGDQ